MNIRKKCPSFLFPYLQKLSLIHYIIIFNWFKLIYKIDENKILMYAPSRETLSGNLYFIYKKLNNKDYKIKIVLKNDNNSTIQLLKEVATSKYIIIDDYAKILYALKMRKQAKFIQVWHAAGAFKRMGFSRSDSNQGSSKNSLTHKNYTDVIVSSDGVVENYSQAFGVTKDKIRAIGIPRTDVFFDKNYIDDQREKFLKKYPSLLKKKLILFAPTFRGATIDKAYYPKEYLDIEDLYNNFSEDYILGLKLHPFIKDKIKIDEKYLDFVIDFSEEREINDILFMTDILITDYSSVIFEYAFLKKKIVFYAPDLEQYIKDRDFFYEYSEYVYGSLSKTKTQLIEAIKNTNIDYDKIDVFYSKFLSECDGRSSQRFVDEIIREF